MTTVTNTSIFLVTQSHPQISHLSPSAFSYYSRVFNFERDAISVRLGRAVPKEVVQYYGGPKNSPHMWKSLCIEGKAGFVVLSPHFSRFSWLIGGSSSTIIQPSNPSFGFLWN